jgi:hypothetical protein
VSTYKLGKGPAVEDSRTLKMEKYTGKLPFPPPHVDYISEVPAFPMYGNDVLSDCVAACGGHMVENWTYNAGKPFNPSEADIITFYENSGYVPGDPTTDNGWELLPALKNMRSKGIGGHKIVAFAKLQPGNWASFQQGVALFGNVMIGVNLPDAVVPSDPGAPDWTTIPWIWQAGMAPNPANGHCVPGMAYAQVEGGHNAHFVSWAAVMVMNKAFYQNVSDEAYVAVTEDWIEADSKSPSGFDITQLLADLTVVTAAGFDASSNPFAEAKAEAEAKTQAPPPSHYWGSGS